MKCWRKWEKFHFCLFSNPKTNQNCCFLLREISRIFKILHAFDQHSRQSLEMLLIYSRVVSSAQLQLSHCCSGFFSRQFNAAASNCHYRNELKTFNSDKAFALNWITSHDKTVSFRPMTSEWFFCLCFCWGYKISTALGMTFQRTSVTFPKLSGPLISQIMLFSIPWWAGEKNFLQNFLLTKLNV